MFNRFLRKFSFHNLFFDDTILLSNYPVQILMYHVGIAGYQICEKQLNAVLKNRIPSVFDLSSIQYR